MSTTPLPHVDQQHREQAPMNTTTAPVSELLREPQVLEMVGLSSITLRRMWTRGEFPKPHKLGKKINVWHVSEVRAWLDALVNKPK